MKVKNKIVILLSSLGAIFATTVISCKKDFLNVTKPNVYSADNYPASVDDLDQSLNGLYGRFRSGFYNPENYRFFAICRDHSGDQAYQRPDFNSATQLSYDNSNIEVYDLWSQTYENIAKCVSVIEDVQNFKTKNPDLSSADLIRINLIEGQARFIRAWNYMIVINYFGETMITNEADKAKMGVPILRKLALSLEETNVSRSTIGEVWDYIILDLKTSEILLNGKTWAGNDIARVSTWAVKGMLGKAYVYTQQWSLASDKLKEVIDGSGKKLVAFNIYKDMFNGKNEFNTESLLELNAINDLNQLYNSDKNVGQRLAIYLGTAYLVPNPRNPKVPTVKKNGYGNFFVHDKNLVRYGFTDTATTEATQSNPVFLAKSLNLRNTKAVDPRLWVYSFQPYLDSIRLDANPARPVVKMPADGISTEGLPAWCFAKYILKDLPWESNLESGINLYILRLADIYLLYAEALVNTGQNTLAIEYINKVKRRAYNQANVNTPSLFDYKSLSDVTMASTDPVLKNDPLKYERWAEFLAEGTWWFDVCRWKLGQSEATFYEKVNTGSLIWQDKKYALPIPIRELNANKNMKPNPGY